MAILEFSARQSRNRVGFVAEDPPAEAVQVLNGLGGYELYRFDKAHLTKPGELATTGAVIFRQVASRPRRVVRELEQYAATLLMHDCRVFVQPVPAVPEANGPAFKSLIVDALNRLKLPPSGLTREDVGKFGEWCDEPETAALMPTVHVLERPGMWRDVAVLLRNNPAGVPPRYDLNIDAIDPERRPLALTPEQDILVRRAFWNCSSIQLLAVSNGRSGVLTFRAFAHVSEDLVGGSCPYLYFVKIGERAKIAKEYRAYREIALEHVPYQLGPRLRLERCALGHDQGIIVSDYVARAETLKACAKDGRAVAALANLFNSTLRAWRDGAMTESEPLQDFLMTMLPTEVSADRWQLIVQYGASRSLDDLRALFVSIESQRVLVGVVHGDLHATNVLIRGSSDAIIIDFEKVENRAPLLRDMASLEGGLFVDGFVGDRRSAKDLLKSVACLYEEAALGSDIAPCHPGEGAAWFFDCVRQIRMQARQVERATRQYGLALAATLLQKACKTNPLPENKSPDGLTADDTRALAYVLAERVLVGLSRRQTAGRP